jgi:hypothetical protein
MPTVGTFAGFRIVIYPNDHRPAHVHVIGRGCVAIFDLNSPHGPAELREYYGDCKRRELRRIRNELNSRLAELCAAWERIHGPV